MKRILLILAACACACAWAGVMSARLGALGRNDNVVTNVDIEGSISDYAATGAVKRAEIYGTPTRWTDSTGCVWEVVSSDWVLNPATFDGQSIKLVFEYGGWAPYWLDGVQAGQTKGNLDSTNLTWTASEAAEALIATRLTAIPYTNYVGRLALTNGLPEAIGRKQDALPYPTNAIPYAAIIGTPSLSGYATRAQVAEAAVAATNYTDGAISTNNAAFVSAVLAVPIAGADAGDLAEIAEYGGYGTVGAAVLALIAGLAALKRRVASAETALAQKADATDLPYALVEPGEWEFSGVPSGWTASVEEDDAAVYLIIRENGGDGYYEHQFDPATYTTLSADLGGSTVVATRSYALADRAGNLVVVTGDTTLTLPAAVPGYCRDFLVRLEISGSSVPTITFAAPTGETITYETDGDEFPVPDEAGDWLYSFTESCVAHKFAVSLKKVNEVAQGGS